MGLAVFLFLAVPPSLPSLTGGEATAQAAGENLAQAADETTAQAAGQITTRNGSPRRFLVETAASEIVVLLFKKGLFSGFAHDHVLVSNALSGEILLPNEQGGGAYTGEASLSLPVESFMVDKPEHREREKLAIGPSEEDRIEIRVLMLGPQQLDAAQYPRISAVLEKAVGTWPLVTAWMRISIRGRKKLIRVPVRVELTGGILTIAGEFEALHSDFGIEPFSSYLGAAAVQDKFRVRVRIEARESL